MSKINIQIYDGQITQNFNIDEFKCQANGEMIINGDVIAHIHRLQWFRDWYNRPMTINSGYRTPAYNKQVGGVSDSQHTLGIATDIALPSEYYGFSEERKSEFQEHLKSKWEELCREDGLQGGIGFYNSFFHMDSRAGNGNIAIWYG